MEKALRGTKIQKNISASDCPMLSSSGSQQKEKQCNSLSSTMPGVCSVIKKRNESRSLEDQISLKTYTSNIPPFVVPSCCPRSSAVNTTFLSAIEKTLYEDDVPSKFSYATVMSTMSTVTTTTMSAVSSVCTASKSLSSELSKKSFSAIDPYTVLPQTPLEVLPASRVEFCKADAFPEIPSCCIQTNSNPNETGLREMPEKEVLGKLVLPDMECNKKVNSFEL